MYEASYSMLKEENNAEVLKKDIIELLKKHNLSLAQTRTLFCDIISKIENTTLSLLN